MKRPWIAAAGLVVALIGLPEVAYLVVVSRPAFRAWLKSELEKTGAGTFTFQTIGGSPLGVSLDGVTFTSRGATHLKSLRAARVEASLRFAPLLRERRVALLGLLAERAEVEARVEGGGAERVAFPVDVPRVRLRDSQLRIANLSGWVATLAGVDAELEQSGSGEGLELGGWIRSTRAAIGSVDLRDVDARFRVARGVLTVTSLTANAYGGVLETAGTMGLDSPQPLRFEHIRISQAEVLTSLKGLGFSSRFAGRADLELSGGGRFSTALHALEAAGRMSLRGFAARAELPRINLFNLAPVLKELKEVTALEGGAQVVLSGERMLFKDLALERPDLRIVGSGSFTLAGVLEASCTGYLRESLARGVPAPVRSSLARTASGDLVVPFRIENTLAEPHVDVDGVMKGTLLHPLKKLF